MPIERELLLQAKKITDQSARIFLVLAPAPSVDVITAAEMISRRLRSAGKEPYGSGIRPPHGWEFLPISTLTEPPAKGRDLLVTVNTRDTPLGELRYEKQNGAVVIVLSPKEKAIPASAVTVSEGAAKTDCIVTIGVESLDTLGDLFQKNPRLFFETPIIALDDSERNDKHGEVNLVDTKAGSITEIAWQLASLISPGSMNKEEATLVLAGILEKTRNLGKETIPSHTFLLAAECVNRGAKRDQIVARLARTERFPLLQLAARALARSRMLETQKTLLSILTADDFAATETTPDDTGGAIRHMENQLRGIERILLLWQDPTHREVRAVLLSHRAHELTALRRSREASIEGDLLVFHEPFSSFIAAENALIPLLATS
ncbi:MAG: hypothetical protein HY471_00690 [Candidatus Sungbacteria bacterium]|nr:hypothetical protein [Candidatus Sungbacteria bacterium]